MSCCCRRKSTRISDVEQPTSYGTQSFESPTFYNGKKGPKFEIVSSKKEFVERRYEPTFWLSTVVAGRKDMATAWAEAGPRLSSYFSGLNKRRVKITRTCPVLCTSRQAKQKLADKTEQVITTQNVLRQLQRKSEKAPNTEQVLEQVLHGKQIKNENSDTDCDSSITSDLTASTVVSANSSKKSVRFNDHSGATTPTIGGQTTDDGRLHVFKFSVFAPNTNIPPSDARIFLEHSKSSLIYADTDRRLSLRSSRWEDIRDRLARRLKNYEKTFEEENWYYVFYDAKQNILDRKYAEVWYKAQSTTDEGFPENIS